MIRSGQIHYRDVDIQETSIRFLAPMTRDPVEQGFV